MFVVTVKTGIKKPKRAIILCVFSLLLIAGIVWVLSNSQKSTAQSKSLGEYSTGFVTEEEKENFLSTFGIDGELVTIDKIIIPHKFNATYKRYNGLQKQIGLNLEAYKGKTAKRFVYKTEGERDSIFVSILVYKGRVIAGHKSTNIYGDEVKSLAG